MPPRQSETGHLPECRRVHAPDMYREHLPELPAGSEIAKITERRIAESEGIYLIMCAEGCPRMRPVLERARQLAKEHGW